MARLLLVQGDQDAAQSLRQQLEAGGHQVKWVGSAAEALAAARSERPRAVLLDLALPDRSGLEVLAELRRKAGRAPVLVMTEDPSMTATLVAMRDGAFDCLPKPVDVVRLEQRLEHALRLTPLSAIEVPELPGDEDRAPELVGSSAAMREVFKMLGLLAASRATVLLRGESGTGKELAARVLHDYGLTAGQEPFVACHCAALPGNLVEGELFGARKGAYTGADADKQGKLEAAGEGTLFLDEVGEIPLDTQVKLLRVLQERQYERLGDTVTRAFQARVIAATHRDLEGLVRDGRFREDLYYRLNVATVTIPPLRERREDIPLIAERLLGAVAREVDRPVTGLSQAALSLLCTHDWPGNVRELRNVLTRAVLRSPKKTIDADDIELGVASSPEAAPLPPVVPARAAEPARFPSLMDVEREHVRRALITTQGHRGRACELLGISRPTLLRKLRKYGLEDEAQADAGEDLEERDVPPVGNAPSRDERSCST